MEEVARELQIHPLKWANSLIPGWHFKKGQGSLKRSLTQSWKLSQPKHLSRILLNLTLENTRQKGQNPGVLESIWHWREEAGNQRFSHPFQMCACLVMSPRQASCGPGVCPWSSTSILPPSPYSFLWIVRDPVILRELIF